MQTRTIGTTMPVLEVQLGPGERITAEGGEVSWYTPGLQLDTSTRFGSGGRGGFMSGLKRALGGGQLFLTEYTAPHGGMVAFAARMPGVFRELTIDRADEFMVQSGSYVASTSDVEVSVALQKRLGAGIFGGAGVVFQKLSGNGTAWVELSGEIVEYDLGAGDSMIVHPGHLALFTSGMDLQFATVKGIKNKFFGDSLLMAEIRGPGHMWLQSMTAAKLAAAIEPYLPDKSGGGNNDS
ncbi:MAG: TIGR00266 family protein [Pseudonocardia sp.]|uniref:TIGR00266 family protein n=1 Tax=unclassified Pseudonocardia TaxID=2619320 RepID=UPI000869BDCC|nr:MULTISPECIES: TIGR00266 family protein [unclassified Pseudonocardia]MBN9111877.1 TIGR00266 family protein [Pseudonocardia sp.]ODU23476.1 MAG: TIGR00266 family protein [Pseudonocardia sp. SCN 72-51]ODV06768.1 MAG: TIGR00266 family protein [Pseudonocardia sp. SCN 73-27]